MSQSNAPNDTALRFAPEGTHILLEIITEHNLKDGAALESILSEAGKAAGARVISTASHEFDGGAGVSAICLLAESHISIHTWPEHKFAAIDVFLCGTTNAEAAAIALQNALTASFVTKRVLDRTLPRSMRNPQT